MIRVLLFIHIGVSLFIICRWFARFFIPTYNSIARVPEEARLLTMSQTEAEFILWCKQNLRGNVLWLPPCDPIVNYYIYPHKMYWRLDLKDTQGIKDRGITLIVKTFEHGKVEVINVA